MFNLCACILALTASCQVAALVSRCDVNIPDSPNCADSPDTCQVPVRAALCPRYCGLCDTSASPATCKDKSLFCAQNKGRCSMEVISSLCPVTCGTCPTSAVPTSPVSIIPATTPAATPTSANPTSTVSTIPATTPAATSTSANPTSTVSTIPATTPAATSTSANPTSTVSTTPATTPAATPATTLTATMAPSTQPTTSTPSTQTSPAETSTEVISQSTSAIPTRDPAALLTFQPVTGDNVSAGNVTTAVHANTTTVEKETTTKEIELTTKTSPSKTVTSTKSASNSWGSAVKVSQLDERSIQIKIIAFGYLKHGPLDEIISEVGEILQGCVTNVRKANVEDGITGSDTPVTILTLRGDAVPPKKPADVEKELNDDSSSFRNELNDRLLHKNIDTYQGLHNGSYRIWRAPPTEGTPWAESNWYIIFIIALIVIIIIGILVLSLTTASSRKRAKLRLREKQHKLALTKV